MSLQTQTLQKKPTSTQRLRTNLNTWQCHYCKYRRSREWSCLEIDGEIRLSGLKCARRKPRALLMLRKWVSCKFLLFFLFLNIWFKVPFGTQERKLILFLKIHSFQLDNILYNNSMRSVRNKKRSCSESTLQLGSEWVALQPHHR